MTQHQQNDSNDSVARLRTALGRGDRHVGDLAWPELRLAGRSIEREELRGWLRAEGLPEEWAPKEPSGQKAFGKAIGRARNLEAAPNVTIERETLRSRVALVRYSVGSGLEKRTETWARVHVSDLDELEVEWSQEPHVQDAVSGAVPSTVYARVQAGLAFLQGEFDRLMRYTDTAELGEMVVDVVVGKLGGVRVRRDGGLYYVSPARSGELRAFARVVQKTGDSRLPFIPVFDTEEGKRNVGRSVHETLMGEVAQVLEGLGRLGGESGQPREAALRRRLAALEALSDRALACQAVLEGFQEDIDSALRRAKAEVLRSMDIEVLGDPLDEEDEELD